MGGTPRTRGQGAPPRPKKKCVNGFIMFCRLNRKHYMRWGHGVSRGDTGTPGGNMGTLGTWGAEERDVGITWGPQEDGHPREEGGCGDPREDMETLGQHGDPRRMGTAKGDMSSVGRHGDWRRGVLRW